MRVQVLSSWTIKSLSESGKCHPLERSSATEDTEGDKHDADQSPGDTDEEIRIDDAPHIVLSSPREDAPPPPAQGREGDAKGLTSLQPPSASSEDGEGTSGPSELTDMEEEREGLLQEDAADDQRGAAATVVLDQATHTGSAANRVHLPSPAPSTETGHRRAQGSQKDARTRARERLASTLDVPALHFLIFTSEISEEDSNDATSVASRSTASNPMIQTRIIDASEPTVEHVEQQAPSRRTMRRWSFGGWEGNAERFRQCFNWEAIKRELFSHSMVHILVGAALIALGVAGEEGVNMDSAVCVCACVCMCVCTYVSFCSVMHSMGVSGGVFAGHHVYDIPLCKKHACDSLSLSLSLTMCVCAHYSPPGRCLQLCDCVFCGRVDSADLAVWQGFPRCARGGPSHAGHVCVHRPLLGNHLNSLQERRGTFPSVCLSVSRRVCLCVAAEIVYDKRRQSAAVVKGGNGARHDPPDAVGQLRHAALHLTGAQKSAEEDLPDAQGHPRR